MFAQAAKSTRHGKTCVTHLVRESFRTAKGPVPRTICNLRRLPEEVRLRAAASLRGEAVVPLRDLKLSGALNCGRLAVATDAEGILLHVEVLRGNRAGNKTLRVLLAALRRRFGPREATFVFEGGMSSMLNLAALDKACMRFVTRQSSVSIR